jgi:DNA replicative helicase MCM subunit Mcm2 (Cdc46/Mcm family)
MIEVNKDRAEADQGLNQDHQNFSEEDVSRFREFSKKPTLYDELVDSLAPSIWEN